MYKSLKIFLLVRSFHRVWTPHSDALTDQYGYAEKDIVILVDNCNLDKSFWPSEVNIVSLI
jgi:hypothetical protein